MKVEGGSVQLESGSGPGAGPPPVQMPMPLPLTQLPVPAVLSPAPSTTMSPPLSEPDRADQPHGGRLRFFGKGAPPQPRLLQASYEDLGEFFTIVVTPLNILIIN